jgi:hypothetical protein
MATYPVPLDQVLASTISKLDRRVKLLETKGNNPIAVGNVIARTSIQSPNFSDSAGYNGWAVNADGTSHFHQVHMVVQASPPSVLVGDNATFTYTIGGWQAVTNCTVALGAMPGSGSAMAITAVAAGATYVALAPLNLANNQEGEDIVIVVGETVTVQSQCYAPIAGMTAVQSLVFVDQNGNSVIGGTLGMQGASHALTSGTPTAVSDTFTVPANAVAIGGLGLTLSGNAAGTVAYTDNWTVVLPSSTSFDAAFLVYNGVPATGTLIGSWSGAAGTDDYGNPYPAGLNVTVGAISGTTFEGTDFVLNSAGMFFYTATPAAGNMYMSVSNNAGSDAYGNTYKAGLTLYNVVGGNRATLELLVSPSQDIPAIQLATGAASEQSFAAVYNLLINTGLATEYENLVVQGPASTYDSTQAMIFLVGNSKNGSGAASGIFGTAVSGGSITQVAYWQTNGLHVVTNLYGVGGILTIYDQVQAVHPGTSSTTETWQNVTPPSGLTGTLRYKLRTDNCIDIQMQLSVASTVASGTTTLFTLPSGYIPSTQFRGPLAYYSNGATTVAQLTTLVSQRFQVSTAGAVQLLGFAGGAVGTGVTEIDGYWRVPLD